MIYDNIDLLRAMEEAFKAGWWESKREPDCQKACDEFLARMRQRILNTRNEVPGVSQRVPPTDR